MYYLMKQEYTIARVLYKIFYGIYFLKKHAYICSEFKQRKF